MKGIFDGRYAVEIVNIDLSGNNIKIKLSYSCRENPGFQEFLNQACLNRTRFSYQDDCNAYTLLLTHCSFALTSYIPEEEKDEDIFLPARSYGEIVNHIPVDQRKAFLLDQAYGSITAVIQSDDWR